MPATRRLFLLAAAGGLVAACREKAPEPSLIGGPFQLIDQDGRPVDQSILKGKWSAVFFGYTFCPDYCPTTLTALGSAEQELGRRARDFQAVMISVDPQRDTPANLKAYVETEVFPETTLGLTGTPEQVDAAAKAYRAFYKRGEGGPDDYLVDHTTVTYLMDPQGRFVKPLAYGTPPAQLAAEIRDAMRQG